MDTPKSLIGILGSWVRDLAPTCHDVARLHSRALDETLPWRVRVGLRCHVLYCTWCRRYGRQLQFLRKALRGDGESLAAGFVRPLPTEARQQIKDRLRQP